MHKTPEITRLIHENFWTVLSFALAKPAAEKVLEEQFVGAWKPLRKTIYETAEIRADRALLELATQLRVLDDAEGLNDSFRRLGTPTDLGSVTQADGTVTALHFRDMTNKIMHAASFSWVLPPDQDPYVVCAPHDPERWLTAKVKILGLMGVVGVLAN